MGVWATLTVLLLFIATVEAAEGGVDFWGKDFTMICPKNGTWFRKEKGDITHEGERYELQYEGKTKGWYRCEYQDEAKNAKVAYHFYVKGKACATCFELDAALVLLAIFGDVLGTAIVMVLIYKFTKKKSSAGLTHASKAPAQSGGRAPPVQSPHYEPLNTHTRSQDPYSFVNRMG